jgi:hypothetical protein
MVSASAKGGKIDFNPATLNLSALEQQYKLPSGLLQSVMKAESAGNPNAVSPAGAQGLFQFMPSTAKAYGVDPFDPQSAAVGAARMYGDLSKQFDGDVPSMLAAYNWGSGNLTKKGLQNAPQETRDYIQRVQAGMANKQYADSGEIMNDASYIDLPPEVESINNANEASLDATIQWYLEGEKAGILNDEEKAWIAEGRAAGFIPGGNVQEKPTSKGYIERVGEDITKSALKGASIITEGTRNPLSAAIQATGQAANMVAAPFAEAAVSGFKALPENWQEGISSAASKVANKVKGGIDNVADSLLETDAGKAFGEYGANSPLLQENLQETLDTAKAAGTIALTLGPTAKVKGKTVASRLGKPAGKLTKNIGKTIRESGDDAAAAAKNKLASDLYTPKLTPTVLKERAANTIAKGINQKPVYVPPANEAAAIKVLQKLPIKKTNTLQKNLNIVSKEVSNEAKSLSKVLQKTPVKYKPAFFSNKIDDALNKVKTDPLIVGDGEKVAERVFSKMKEITAKNPNTPDGLLKSRIQFDRWATSKRGSVFDANDTAFSTAVRSARNTTNDFISDIAPNATVKSSLQKQSQLLGAMDNMETKIPWAPKTRLGMAKEGVSKFIPDSGIGKLAGLGAIAGVGYAAPAVTIGGAALGGAGYGAYKAATSPLLRQMLGTTIEASAPAVQSAVALSPLAAFGAKFDRKVTNKPIKGE